MRAIAWTAKSFHVQWSALLALYVALATPGCAAAPASIAGMAFTRSTQGATTPAMAGAMRLGDVEGGRPTNPLGASQVENEKLRAALEASLRAHGLWAGGADAPFTLRTVLADMDQPLAGLDMTVSVTVHYTVTDGRGGTLFDEKITTHATATFRDAFAGVKRLRIATERAVRTNIESVVRALLRVKSPAPRS